MTLSLNLLVSENLTDGLSPVAGGKGLCALLVDEPWLPF